MLASGVPSDHRIIPSVLGTPDCNFVAVRKLRLLLFASLAMGG